MTIRRRKIRSIRGSGVLIRSFVGDPHANYNVLRLQSTRCGSFVARGVAYVEWSGGVNGMPILRRLN